MADSAKKVPPLPRLIARLTGARLCFGRPVTANGRTVIPVASVRSAGGGGFGRGPDEDAGGGGGGGMLEAHPVGFIEISSEGTRFERIDDGRMALRALATGSFAVLVAARMLTRRHKRLPDGAQAARRLRGRATAALPAPVATARRGRKRATHTSHRS
jgi:uncharacterized spore protein YtfJ